jgi:hypothetical protein
MLSVELLTTPKEEPLPVIKDNAEEHLSRIMEEMTTHLAELRKITERAGEDALKAVAASKKARANRAAAKRKPEA